MLRVGLLRTRGLTLPGPRCFHVSRLLPQRSKLTNPLPKTTAKLKELLPEHENIYTIPNMLTLTRLVSAPVIGALILKHQIWLSFGLFVYSSVTDFVDGYIARRWNMRSVVGSVIDPMADKVLMVICTGCLTAIGQIPVYLAVVILGRDGLLGLSAVYYRYISLPEPKTLNRFWDFSIPSAQVFPTTISKYNTLFQMVYIAGEVVRPALVTLIDPANAASIDLGFTVFGGFVGITTVISGLSYVFSKDAVRILKAPKTVLKADKTKDLPSK